MIARTRKNVNKYLQIYFHRDRFVDIYKDRFTVVALSSVGHAVFLSFILRDSHYLQMTENKTKYHRKQKKKQINNAVFFFRLLISHITHIKQAFFHFVVYLFKHIYCI